MRTPIQPILGIADLKGFEFENDGNQEISITKDEMAIIIRNAKRLERLTSDILEIARIEGGSMHLDIQQFDLHHVISPLVEEANNKIKGEGKDIEIHYSPSDLIMKGDKGRLAEVIRNLLDNAIKFTEKGSISIEAGKGNSEASVTVKDSGCGIDVEVLAQLFTKFVTKSYKGTGLGLFISKSIIEAHGGRIWS